MMESGSLQSESDSKRSLGGIRMQDEHKLYAHADNEFEAEADEYPDEVEEGFDDDEEEEEEVSVIVATVIPGAELLTAPVSVPPVPPPTKAPAKKAAAKKAVAKP